MSLLLGNQLLAVIGIDSVAVVSKSRGLGSRVTDQRHLVFTQDSNDNVWEHASKKLDAMLASMEIKPKSKFQITLASDFVRYLSLPSQHISMTEAEKLAYATASYKEIHGAVVDEWEIKLHDNPNHSTSIAVAIDKKLLAMLQQIANKYQLKLASVQPYLMTVFNRLSEQIAKTNGYLAILEFKRLLLVSLNKGCCVNVHAYPLSNDWQVDFKNLLLRESLLTETKHREILIYAPTQKNIAINAIEGWELKRISTPRTLKNYHYAMLEASV